MRLEGAPTGNHVPARRPCSASSRASSSATRFSPEVAPELYIECTTRTEVDRPSERRSRVEANPTVPGRPGGPVILRSYRASRICRRRTLEPVRLRRKIVGADQRAARLVRGGRRGCHQQTCYRFHEPIHEEWPV